MSPLSTSKIAPFCFHLGLKGHQTFHGGSTQPTHTSLPSGISFLSLDFEQYINQKLIDESAGIHHTICSLPRLFFLSCYYLGNLQTIQTSVYSLLLKIYSAFVTPTCAKLRALHHTKSQQSQT